MAFSHAADFSVEPNIAFYELAAHAERANVLHELLVFYRSIAVPTHAWADVALGRSDNIAIRQVDVSEASAPQPDLKKPLYRWQRNYILALKLAEVHLKGGKPITLMTELLEWMYRDFLIGGPALQLASLYLAPGAPRHRLLKGIESRNRDKALKPIQNAAWDLTLVSEWLRLVKPLENDPSHKSVYILCTLDRTVRRLARSLVSFDERPISDEKAIFWTFGPYGARKPPSFSGPSSISINKRPTIRTESSTSSSRTISLKP
jgi:hypothetical protein